MQPPALGPRVLARLLDGFLISIPLGTVARVVESHGWARGVVIGVMAVAYETIAIAMHGRTVGKNICHIAVVDPEGRRPTWRQAFIRAVVLLMPLYMTAPRIDTPGEWLVLLFVLANYYVIAKRRDDRRGIHDLAASTRAIAVDARLAA